MFGNNPANEQRAAGSLGCPRRFHRSVQPSVSSGVMGIKIWQPWLGQGGFPLYEICKEMLLDASNVPPTSLTAPSGPRSSFRPASLIKTSQDGGPRWLRMTVMAKGMLGDAESRRVAQSGVTPHHHFNRWIFFFLHQPSSNH